MEVRFTHPRTSDTYVAEISTQLTAKEALQALLSSSTGPFLPPIHIGEDYTLVLRRTSTVIPANATMGSVGVMDNDMLDVMLGGQGA